MRQKIDPTTAAAIEALLREGWGAGEAANTARRAQQLAAAIGWRYVDALRCIIAADQAAQWQRLTRALADGHMRLGKPKEGDGDV